MKSVPSIAYLTCWLAPYMVADSFTPTTLRIQQFTSTSAECPNNNQNDSTTTTTRHTSTLTSLQMGYGDYGNGRSSSRYANAQERTKRQERVGHVVRSELATILHRGTSIKNDNDPIEMELQRRINLVHVDVSPDLRQARVTVSIMASGSKNRGGGGSRGDDDDDEDDTTNYSRRGADNAIAKRRAYAWLVRNTKAIRHALAQKMAHMKGGSPDLTFVQVDVGAAVDVMQLIEKVSEGYKREDVLEMGFEEDGEWDEEDGDDDDGWFDFDEDGDGISVEVEV